MKRAAKLSLKFLTASKRRKIAALLSRYRSAVNFFIRECWFREGDFNGKTLACLKHSLLSARYKSQALKQACEIVSGTHASAVALNNTPTCPRFTGSATLDAKFVKVTIEPRGQYFDVFMRLSSLVKGKLLTLPLKATAMLRKWLSVPGARLIQGCSLSENSLTLWVEVPTPELRTEGDIIAIDLGMCKLITTSEGEFIGRSFRDIRDKINRRKPGSKSRQRAFRERDIFIGWALNRLPWYRLKAIGMEELAGIKHGKKPNRNKGFRRAIAPWVHRQVANRVEHKAAENGVLCVTNDPRGTFRRCPACGTERKDNRQGEKFRCKHCGHTGGADFIGATNILAKTCDTLGIVKYPKPSCNAANNRNACENTATQKASTDIVLEQATMW